MNLHQINPYIRFASHSHLEGRFCVRERAIYDYELLFVADGHFRLHYNGKDYRCKKGDILLLHPGVIHSFHYDGADLTQPHIHFDLIYDKQSKSIPISFAHPDQMSPEEKLQIREDLLISSVPSPFISVQRKEDFLALFFELINSYGLTTTSTELICKSLMLRLLDCIIQENYSHCFHPQNKELTAMESIKSYVDANYAGGIDMSTLTSLFHFSRSYIEKSFKAKYGVTVIHYASSLRMQQAKLLLEHYSVTSVAEQLGFSSIYSFSRAFRNTFGISPTDYMRENGSYTR